MFKKNSAARSEIEVKFTVADLKALARKLRAAGFRIQNPRAHEMNTLYDAADRSISARGEVLRIRKYGTEWTLTHKSRGVPGPHKQRLETETIVLNGAALEAIFHTLGLSSSFRYEKYRTEWTDGKGHVVVDETPIGNFAEIEGSSRWIDSTAKKLGVPKQEYSSASYAHLFYEWKSKNKSQAQEMTWKAIAGK